MRLGLDMQFKEKPLDAVETFTLCSSSYFISYFTKIKIHDFFLI